MPQEDPAVRKDGKCALDGCTKPLPMLALQDKDPFHSTLCARRHYGVVFLSDERAAHPTRSMTA